MFLQNKLWFVYMEPGSRLGVTRWLCLCTQRAEQVPEEAWLLAVHVVRRVDCMKGSKGEGSHRVMYMAYSLLFPPKSRAKTLPFCCDSFSWNQMEFSPLTLSTFSSRIYHISQHFVKSFIPQVLVLEVDHNIIIFYYFLHKSVFLHNKEIISGIQALHKQ